MPIKVQCSNCFHPLSAPDSFAGRKIKCPICNAPIPVKATPPPLDDAEELVLELPAAPAATLAPLQPVVLRNASSALNYKLVIATCLAGLFVILFSISSGAYDDLHYYGAVGLLIAAGALKSQLTDRRPNSGWFVLEDWIGKLFAGASALLLLTLAAIRTADLWAVYQQAHDARLLGVLAALWFVSLLLIGVSLGFTRLYDEFGFFKVAAWCFLLFAASVPVVSRISFDVQVLDGPLADLDPPEFPERNADHRPPQESANGMKDEEVLARSREDSRNLQAIVDIIATIRDQDSFDKQKALLVEAISRFETFRLKSREMVLHLPLEIQQRMKQVDKAGYRQRESIVRVMEQEARRLQTQSTVWADLQKLLPRFFLQSSRVLAANPPPPGAVNPNAPRQFPLPERPSRPQLPATAFGQPRQRNFLSMELEFSRKADMAFRFGEFVQGVDYWRADLIAVAGEKLAGELRWCAALKRPTLGLVWGFGGVVSSEFDAPPFDSDDQHRIARQLTLHTGDTGELFVEAIERRVKQRLYGSYVELVEDRANRLEGVHLIPVGVQADVLAAARRQHCDVVAIGDVKTVGAQDSAIVLRIFDPLVEKPLWESESLRATKITRERKKGNDPAKDLVAGAVKFLEERLGLTDMPTLKKEIVERRADSLASAESVTLNGLAELFYYHDAELLDAEKYQQCLVKAFGDETGKLLGSDNEHERREGLAKVLEKAKPSKRRLGF